MRCEFGGPKAILLASTSCSGGLMAQGFGFGTAGLGSKGLEKSYDGFRIVLKWKACLVFYMIRLF